MSRRKPEDVHRRVKVRMWLDAKFRSLSAPAPSAQVLWLYLLTGPSTCIIPGVHPIGENALAEVLGWPLKALRSCWLELEEQGMAVASWSDRLIWLPKSIDHNPPANAKVAQAWGGAFAYLPECDLRDRVFDELADHLDGRGGKFTERLAVTLPVTLQERLRERSPVTTEDPYRKQKAVSRKQYSSSDDDEKRAGAQSSSSSPPATAPPREDPPDDGHPIRVVQSGPVPVHRQESQLIGEDPAMGARVPSVQLPPGFCSGLHSRWQEWAASGAFEPCEEFHPALVRRTRELYATSDRFRERHLEILDDTAKRPRATGGGSRGWKISLAKWLAEFHEIADGKYSDARSGSTSSWSEDWLPSLSDADVRQAAGGA